MSAETFNQKYAAQIVKGYSGLEFSHTEVEKVLDDFLSGLPSNTLKIYQIKLKFGFARVYIHSPNIMPTQTCELETKINQLLKKHS